MQKIETCFIYRVRTTNKMSFTFTELEDDAIEWNIQDATAEQSWLQKKRSYGKLSEEEETLILHIHEWVHEAADELDRRNCIRSYLQSKTKDQLEEEFDVAKDILAMRKEPTTQQYYKTFIMILEKQLAQTNQSK